jgi:hypothetical protein
MSISGIRQVLINTIVLFGLFKNLLDAQPLVLRCEQILHRITVDD